jgi:pyruvate,water dikinase
MTAPSMPMPTPIPLPADFPVKWDAPEEAMMLWEWEQQHLPLPLSPLAYDILGMCIFKNLAKGLRGMGAPISHALTKRVNTFAYITMVPDFALMEGVEERIKASVKDRGFTMYQTWLNTYLPEVDAANQKLIDFNFGAASDAELLSLTEWALKTMDRVWEIHFELMPGFYIATALKESCARLLGMEGLEAYELMQGGPNLSVESGSKMWQLAHAAPAPVKAIVGTNHAREAWDKLSATVEGQAFQQTVQDYCAVYGWRSGSFDVYDDSWAEDPALALDSVRLMLKVDRDPAADQRRGAERAEAIAEDCRKKLADNPAALGEFNFLYAACKGYPQMQEDHNFHIDQKYLALARRPYVEAGKRMAKAGVVGEPRDFPYMKVAEVQAFLAGDRSDLTATVNERKAEVAKWKNHIPPQHIGSKPPFENNDPFAMDFGGVQVESSRDPLIIKGNPGARGTATGTARVIRTLAEADRVQEGDILVCDTTTPAWTPIFASLAGIVADSGGALSHCAVVAREYGLPCIVGTRVGTRQIPDGVRITIDGAQGIVRIEK